MTGATGFIGSHLVRKLVQRGFEVIIFKRSTSNTWRIEDLLGVVKIHDVDKYNMEDILEEAPVNIIVHMSTCYGRKNESIEEIIESNITFPINLLDTAFRKSVRCFINTDTSLGNASSFYDVTKKGFVAMLHYYLKRGLRVINLKLEYVYGPYDDYSKFIPSLINSTLIGKTLLATEGIQKRDFVYIDDVTEAYIHALKLLTNAKNIWDRILDIEIGSGTSITLREFASIVEEAASKKANIKWGGLPFRNNEVFDSKAALESAREVLGWKPCHNIHDGVKKTVEWYRRHGEIHALL